MSGAGDAAEEAAWDFFMSYAEADQQWADWVAWQLEQAGFRVLMPAWDLVPGSNKQFWTHRGVEVARHTVALVSASYTDLERGPTDWTAAQALDPHGLKRTLVPIRIDDSPLPGLFISLVPIDLFGLTADEARTRLIDKIEHTVAGNARLAGPPTFPRTRPPGHPRTTPLFPGAGANAEAVAEVSSAAGPGTPVNLLDNPVTFGVHRAIDAAAPRDGPSLPMVPIYVPRQHDEQLRTIVQQAVGGASAAVVLVGDSSSGKSRTCWEAVMSLPRGWRLWRPISPSPPQALLSGLACVGPRTVVWLDDAHDYLLTTSASALGEQVAAGLRDLVQDQGRRPVLILAAMWREEWARLTTRPKSGQPDPCTQARALLAGNAITVPNTFSPDELDALRIAAEGDPRLADALVHAGHGQVTQYLAAAPALLERYDTAPAATKALIQAAMDSRRLGHSPALSEALLRSAAPGYLNDHEWDAAGNDWFAQALDDATARCRGAGGMLTRIRQRQPDEGPPSYRLADYLDQHGRRTRRMRRVPETLWDALLVHATDIDAPRLATSAQNRLLLRHAISFHRRALGTGEWFVAHQLADLLLRRGDVDGAVAVWRAKSDPRLGMSAWLVAHPLANVLKEYGDATGAVEVLREHADAGNEDAAHELSVLLVELGDIDTLRTRAKAGDWHAASKITEILAERGGEAELRARADAGDWYAATCLTDLLIERGDQDGAIAILRAFADMSSESALQLAELLIDRSCADEAVEVLRGHADTAWDAAYLLSDLLAQRDETSAAVEVLRAHAHCWQADEYEQYIGPKLADLLVASGKIDELRERADAGDWYTEDRLDALLADTGDLDALRARANAGHWHAAIWLAHQGDVESAIQALRVGVDAGDISAAIRLADLLAAHSFTEAAIEVLRTIQLAAHLTSNADIDYEDFGAVGRKHADLLNISGGVDVLRVATENGDLYAAERLAHLLTDRGDLHGAVEVLQPFADNGVVSAANWIVNLLAEAGDLDGLRALVDEGDWFAARKLPDLLAAHGRTEDAENLFRFGLNPDGSIAAGH